MALLHFLEGIRTPFFDSIVAVLTELGGETVFIIFGLLILWCFSKRNGYYLLTVCYSGIILSQFLKILCRIPRPWVQDPSFTIVESAREAATGYSFPSGHTTNAACTAGAIAAIFKKKWVTTLCVALIILVGFSRMYLGVHTPLDVGVAIALSAALIFIIDRVYRKIDKNPHLMYVLFSVIILINAAYLLYTCLWPFPADVDAANLESARTNGCSLLGASLGMILAYFIDQKYIRFEVSACWWAQIIKFILGAAILIGIKSLLKTPLNAIFGEIFGRIVRYFLMLMFIGAIWPMTFKSFAKLGGKKA